MNDRHTTHRQSLEHNAYVLQLQIDYHLSTYNRIHEEITKETTEEITKERAEEIKRLTKKYIAITAELHQQLIDTKRKLRAMQAICFPPPPQPTQPTKGEYDMTMIYTPTFEDYNNENK